MNKYEKAYSEISLSSLYTADIHKQLLLIKELVEKTIEKEITYTEGKLIYEDWICPHCKDERDPYDEPRGNYCSNCGGALIEET